MKQLIIITILLFTFNNCKTVKKNDATIKPQETFFSLYRSSCYGECPSYKIIISEDGKLDYIGRMWVINIGEFKGVLSEEKTKNLFEKLKTYDWKNYPDEYPIDNTDFPSFTIEYSNSEFYKKVKGNTNASKELIALTKKIDSLIKELDLEENAKK